MAGTLCQPMLSSKLLEGESVLLFSPQTHQQKHTYTHTLSITHTLTYTHTQTDV